MIISLGEIMLSSQINNKILYIYIYSALIYAGFNMHIFWPKAQKLLSQTGINFTVLLQKLQCMANAADLSQLGKSWKC